MIERRCQVRAAFLYSNVPINGAYTIRYTLRGFANKTSDELILLWARLSSFITRLREESTESWWLQSGCLNEQANIGRTTQASQARGGGGEKVYTYVLYK